MVSRNIYVELQSYGVRFNSFKNGRVGGAGPSEGVTFILDKFPLCVPAFSHYVRNSPFSYDINKGVIVDSRDGRMYYASLVEGANFYRFRTKGGLEYKKIALLHGRDCLGTTIFQACHLWGTDDACRFCGIGLSLKNKNTIVEKKPDDLAEVAEKAKETDVIRVVKERTSLPIHIQITPQDDHSVYKELKYAGADTIGIHIESFDLDVLDKIAPFKSSLGLKRFLIAWEYSVGVFGKGQVSSFIIAGIGERFGSIMDGW